MPPETVNSSKPSDTERLKRLALSCLALGQNRVRMSSYNPWIVWEQQTGADLLDLLESLLPAKSADAQPPDSKSSG